METGDTTEQLGAIAQSLWCQTLLSKGWRKGATRDESAHTHDAMVPFAELSEQRRFAICEGIRALGIEQRFVKLMEILHAMPSEIGINDVRVGTLVRHAVPTKDVVNAHVGTVESWKTDSAGKRMTSLRVRWDDGEITEHLPAERDLWLLG